MDKSMMCDNRKRNYVWYKGNRKLYGRYGTKHDFALDLIIMKDIRISKKDIEFLKLGNTRYDRVSSVFSKKASELLESKGWKWKKIND